MVSPEVRPGLLIISTSLLALLLCNIGYADYYYSVWNQAITIKLGDMVFKKQVLALINEGLMAFFFLMITIEIRYECLYGFLDQPKYFLLPLFGAIGGMTVPALIYLSFNYSYAYTGWAIPVATDIAFSLACLMLLGSRFSPRLRIFLLSIAIFDDLGAILIIALFYSSKLSISMLGIAILITLIMYMLREYGYKDLKPYFLLGALLWASLLKSGVHATLSGSIVALMLPMSSDQGKKAKGLYEGLLPWVQFGILPIFTFANSGVVFSKGIASQPLFLGIVLGLVLGKPLGIISFSYLANYLKLSSMPNSMNYHHIIGVSFLCGIGYTMSLFIGTLAFENKIYLLDTVKISVILGSLLASLLGILYLYTFCKEP